MSLTRMFSHRIDPGRLAALLLFLCLTVSAQDRNQKTDVKNNPLLVQHSNFFDKKIYDLQTDKFSQPHVPKGLAYKAYSAVGFDLANTMWIIGPDNGIIVVDTLGDEETASKVIKLFLAESFIKTGNLPEGKLPIKAVIYTHNHIDHTGGVAGYLKAADRPPCAPETLQNQGQDGSYTARADCVEIIAQKNIVDSVINTGTVVGTIINPRSAYMYGSFLRGGPVNDGIGPQVNKGDPGPGFHMPSKTFTNELKLTAAGVNMKLVYAPSETNDELAVFLPDARNKQAAGSNDSKEDFWGGPGLLLSAEIIQGPAFPNLYSLRGTSYRNPAQWFRSVDEIRKFDSWCMIPSHGPPLCGQNNIQLLLRNFRDAIQYTHDQTVRLMNRGHTPDEMAAHLNKLPDYMLVELEALRSGMPSPDMNPLDYLLPFYGSVPQAVRELYFGYLGWYEADPSGLEPTPPKELAARLVKMMGGRDNVLKTAEAALEEGDKKDDKGEYQWAAELTTFLIRIDHDDRQARSIKAKAFLKLAEPQQKNPGDWRNWDTNSLDPNWRNWYLTSREELSLPNNVRFPPITGGLVSPDIVSNLPPGAWVNSWTMRLDSEKSINRARPISMGFLFPAEQIYKDSRDQRYVVKIRKAIAEFYDLEPAASGDSMEAKDPLKTWEETDVAISITREALRELLTAEAEAISERYRKLEKAVIERNRNGQSTGRDDSGNEPKDPFLTALIQAIEQGKVKLLKGTVKQVEEFFSYFDSKMITSPYLTVR